MRFRKSILFILAGTSVSLGCESQPSEALSATLMPSSPAPVVQQGEPAEDGEILARARGLLEPTADTPNECPENMILVEGEYCPEVRQRCLRYMDPPGRYHEFRCAEYAKSECLSKQRVPMRFCIDRDEYAEPGETLPANHRSFTHADKTCRSLDKRVCRESEWVFACEGPQMRPYPYGSKRDPSACNADRTDILSKGGELRDLRAPADAFPRCVSEFGVRNLAGNLEEFVAMDGPGPARPAMKGAYWQPSRNYCRAKQTAHDRFYNGTETGFRCCADAESGL